MLTSEASPDRSRSLIGVDPFQILPGFTFGTDHRRKTSLAYGGALLFIANTADSSRPDPPRSFGINSIMTVTIDAVRSKLLNLKNHPEKSAYFTGASEGL